MNVDLPQIAGPAAEAWPLLFELAADHPPRSVASDAPPSEPSPQKAQPEIQATWRPGRQDGHRLGQRSPALTGHSNLLHHVSSVHLENALLLQLQMLEIRSFTAPEVHVLVFTTASTARSWLAGGRWRVDDCADERDRDPYCQSRRYLGPFFALHHSSTAADTAKNATARPKGHSGMKPSTPEMINHNDNRIAKTTEASTCHRIMSPF